MGGQRIIVSNFKIGIVGTGNIGLQIIKLLAANHIESIAFSRNPARAQELLSIKMKKNSGISSSEIKYAKFTDKLEELSSCNVIIECLPEDLILKRSFFEKIKFNSELIITSSTSTFTLQQMTHNLNSKNCINIVHFSNPVSRLSLVEVVFSPRMSIEQKKFLSNFLDAINREIVVVPDVPGFILNNLLFALLKESLLMSSEKNISPETINKVMKLGCNFPLGPFEIISLIGKDTTMKIFESLNIVLSEQEIQLIESI
jgi:3-hydroxyacyl-CoA dehydrogenase